MSVVAFDSKEYSRSTKTQLKFYTPLGVGIKFTDPEEAKRSYIENLEDLAPRFGIENCCGALSPSDQYRKLGPSKTLRLSDELLQRIQDQIEYAYFSYVILPPKDTPTIKVGGYSSPSVELSTFDFLKRLSVYYSYITAWSYIGIEERKKDEIILDGFRGPRTYAWDDIITETTPRIYSHGDECNPLISTADILAFLTDKKLYAAYKHLEPASIEEVWKDYSFEKNVHFLDQNVLSKIRWYTNDTIDITDYYVHPTVFLYSDHYKMKGIKTLAVFPYATRYARMKNGCVRGFNKAQDSKLIKDGDVFTYAGLEAKNLATTLQDIVDIEILTFRELRSRTIT